MSQSHSPTSRRDFLKTAAVTAAGAAVLPSVHAAGSDVLKVGLVGCGGRGSGAASQAAGAGEGIKIVAMADLFKDQLQASRGRLAKELGDKFDVKDDHCFVGFDAYKQLIDSGVDVVLLATPTHFRAA
jgi:predicted dehydrogenase